jgi:hypothetical protein
MIGDIHISDHAVNRFVQRHAPEMTFNDAKSLLIRRSLHAVALKQKTIKGDNQWRISDPDVILVGKYVNNGIVCVTILPEPEFFGISEEDFDRIHNHIDDVFDERSGDAGERREEVNERLLDAILTPSQRHDLEQRKLSLENQMEKLRYSIMQEYISRHKPKTITKGPRKGMLKALEIAMRALLKLKGNPDIDYTLAEIQRICPESLKL